MTKLFVAGCCMWLLIALPSRSLLAQDGPFRENATDSNSSASTPERAEVPIAMNGYCPVSILERRRWVKGDAKFAVVLDGKKYLFPSEEAKNRYLSNTVRYTPALGSDCIVCAVKGIARHPGSIHFTAIHNERLYMFPSDEEKSEFMKEPAKYADRDIALDGNCIVSKVDSGTDVKGREEFGTVLGGIRFLFPSLEHRKKFLANPTRYLQPVP